ncbi:MAG: hypothetical protein IKD59_01140 [Lachnospiraceae bacterium]|nr:hypothetical protein [Lachnospiraceae bacterium]
MTQTEWIISLDDDLKDYDELFVGNVRDGDRLTRCKDCKHWQCDDSESYCDELGIFNTDMNSYCSYAKREEE